MATLKELLAQREALEKQIEDAKKTAREEGLTKVREVMEEYGLTPADLPRSLMVGAKPGAKPAGKVPAKYRDPETGSTWSGRGIKPKWFAAAIEQGKKPEEFAV